MKVVLSTVLILLGLWTNLLGSVVMTCDGAGDCCPIEVESCSDCTDHHHEHHSGEVDEEDEKPTPRDTGTDSDDHHHCSHHHTPALALPPFATSRLLSLPFLDDAIQLVASAPPEAIVSPLEEPPQV